MSPSVTSAFLVLLGETSLRATAVAGAVGAILLLARIRDGALRHTAWRIVLVAMLTMPLLSAVVPDLAIPIPAAQVTLLRVEPTLEPELAPAAGRAVAPGTGVAPARRTASIPPPPDLATGRASRQWSWLDALAGVYLAGVLVFLIRLGAGWRGQRRLVRSSARIAEGRIAGCDAPVLESALLAIGQSDTRSQTCNTRLVRRRFAMG